MPSGCASRRGRLAVPIDRLATTSSSGYDPAQVLRSGGGWLTRLVELAPPAIHQAPTCQGSWRHLTPRRSARMLSAYVLILTEVGKVAHVAQALSDLDGVQEAEDITGPYDIIAKIQAPSLDQLGRLVVSRIQVVDGVTRTLTCTVIRR
jgi:DNA-binding Lrp family transcriptional regulator